MVPPNTPAAVARLPAVSAPVPPAPPSPPVAGLPPDAPKLVLGGGVYSASRAQRMLIVNGQVFNEGSEVAPGVTLEEMKARTVVLRFRGARYTVAY
jgi:general secretion pathway protein B